MNVGYVDHDDYWKRSPEATRGPEDLLKTSPHKDVYKLYVCDTCRIAFGHPMSYCPSCPGKMVRIEGGSYRDFVVERPGYHWGEDAIWEERPKLYNRLARAEEAGAVIPCVVTTWVYVSRSEERRDFYQHRGTGRLGEVIYAKLIPRLIRELGHQSILVREVTDQPDYVEVRIYFPSFGEFREWLSAHWTRGIRYRIDPA